MNDRRFFSLFAIVVYMCGIVVLYSASRCTKKLTIELPVPVVMSTRSVPDFDDLVYTWFRNSKKARTEMLSKVIDTYPIIDVAMCVGFMAFAAGIHDSLAALYVEKILKMPACPSLELLQIALLDHVKNGRRRLSNIDELMRYISDHQTEKTSQTYVRVKKPVIPIAIPYYSSAGLLFSATPFPISSEPKPLQIGVLNVAPF